MEPRYGFVEDTRPESPGLRPQSQFSPVGYVLLMSPAYVPQDPAPPISPKERPMATHAVEHHEKAAEHHEHAARHHPQAAAHHESGAHETAAQHGPVAPATHLYPLDHAAA